jgi:hypothetical protein
MTIPHVIPHTDGYFWKGMSLMKFDNTEKTDIEKKADIEKEERCIKEIRDLVGRYVKKDRWELEKEISNLDSPILIRINYPAEVNRPLPEIDKFKNELASILHEHGFGIGECCDTGISIDTENRRKNRRIEITLKRRL